MAVALTVASTSNLDDIGRESNLGDANVLNGIQKILCYNYRGRTTEVRVRIFDQNCTHTCCASTRLRVTACTTSPA